MEFISLHGISLESDKNNWYFIRRHIPLHSSYRQRNISDKSYREN